jgi:hypothetical protein
MTDTWRSFDAYIGDHNAAAMDLGAALVRGEMAIFLGAGVSVDSNLPKWNELVRRCCLQCNIDCTDITPDTDSETLRFRMDAVEEKMKVTGGYLKGVHDALYDAYIKTKTTYQPTRLLQALGALMMGSRRGCARDILTLNYDDVLEHYLTYHGYIADVITEPQRLRRNLDVSVYHPNGFLPMYKENKWTSKIVFSQESFGLALGDGNPWKRQIQQLLETRIVLAVGMSFRDPVITSLAANVKAIAEASARPTAFWLTTDSANPDELRSMKKHQIVALCCKDYKDYPDFLLSICQSAAEIVEGIYGVSGV